MSTKKMILGALVALALIVGLGLYFHGSAKAHCPYCPLPGGWGDTGPCNKNNGRADAGQIYRCSSNCQGCDQNAPCTCTVVQCYNEGPNPFCYGWGADYYTDYCYNCAPKLCPCDVW